MIDLFGAAAVATLAWSATVTSVSLEAIRRTIGRRPRSPERSATIGAVLAIRPCAGLEPRLAENLRSIALARRSFALRYRIAVADRADAAYPSAVAAAEALSAEGVDARVVITRARGPNRKVSQLAAVVAAEADPFDAILVADSDVDLAGADLDLLVQPLAEPSTTDVVWAPPIEPSPPRTLADRASAAVLGASLHAFPLLARIDPGGLCGKLFAVQRAAISAIGGLGALGSHLGEDMELARRIHARGGVIEAAPMVARSTGTGRSRAQVVARFARWITVIRAQRPALLPTYPLLFFATPLILIAAAITAPAAPRAAAAAAVLAVASRIAVALTAAFATGRSTHLGRAVVDAALADAILAAAFARAVRSRKVVWRDSEITIDRRGRAREAVTPRADPG